MQYKLLLIMAINPPSLLTEKRTCAIHSQVINFDTKEQSDKMFNYFKKLLKVMKEDKTPHTTYIEEVHKLYFSEDM